MNLSSEIRSSSGSSSIGGSRNHRRRVLPLCYCGNPSFLYTSRTPKNPNRGFYGCVKYKENMPYCKFFKWVDDAAYEFMEVEEERVNKLELDAIEMEFKMKYMEMKLNEQVKLNDLLQAKLKEHEMKISELCMKMVTECEIRNKECRHVRLCAWGLAMIMVIVFLMCISGGKWSIGTLDAPLYLN